MTEALAVPGPPRGRRTHTAAALADRIEAMRAVEREGGGPSALLRVLRDVILLFKDLVGDQRVPVRAKVAAGLALGYVVSPRGAVPDRLRMLGLSDKLAVALLAVRHLIGAAGYDVVYDRWRGSGEGLALVLTLAGVNE